MGRLATLIGHNSRVTTRMIDDIPGCIPAVDVFVDHDGEVVRAHIVRQANQYGAAIKAYVDGAYGGIKGEPEMWFDATKGNIPLVFIRNPSKRDYLITGSLPK